MPWGAAPAAPKVSGVFPRPATLVAFLLIWVACAIGASAALWAADRSNQASYTRLDRRGVRTQATVIDTEPKNHNTVYYSFVVAGRTYTTGNRAHGGKSADELRIGESIEIVYDPLNPVESCNCDPHERRRSARPFSVVFTGFFLGGGLAVPLFAWWHRSRRAKLPGRGGDS